MNGFFMRGQMYHVLLAIDFVKGGQNVGSSSPSRLLPQGCDTSVPTNECVPCER